MWALRDGRHIEGVINEVDKAVHPQKSSDNSGGGDVYRYSLCRCERSRLCDTGAAAGGSPD